MPTLRYFPSQGSPRVFNVHKPVTTVEQRLVHVFPVVRDDAIVRVETPAAVIRPYPQSRGDLLPGYQPVAEPGSTALLASEATGDSLPDLLAVNRLGDSVTLLAGDGTGHFDFRSDYFPLGAASQGTN